MFGIAAKIGSAFPQLVEIPEPRPPGNGEVLCRTIELGICGTDRDILNSRQPEVPESCDYLILGHECLAQVEQIGSGVDTLFPGQFVVPLVRRPTGIPEVRVDLASPGTFIERGILGSHGFSSPFWLDQPDYLLPVPDDIICLAVLVEPISIAEKGINEAVLIQHARLGVSTWLDAPPRVLVTGMGPIGFATVIACRSREWPVTMYGRDPSDSFRAQLVRNLGSSYTTTLESASEQNGISDNPFDLILDCTGSEEVILRTAGNLSPRGVMVWLGSSRHAEPKMQNLAPLIRQMLVRNNIVIGSVNSAPRDFQDALMHLSKMQRTHSSDLLDLITDRVKPKESLWHYEQRRPQGIKTVLIYGD